MNISSRDFGATYCGSVVARLIPDPVTWARQSEFSTECYRAFLRRGVSSERSLESGAGGSPARRTPKMARLEAVLLVTDAALSPKRVAQLATLADATEARTLINRINASYEHSGSPFRIERVASGYRMLTLPQFAFWLGKLHHREAELKLSPPMMETLTIVAYRQPITRADIESIRGVQCAEMIKQLMDRGLVRIGGEDDSLGRPFLYETTRAFLESFGLRDLEELPLAEKLRHPNGTPATIIPESAQEATPAIPGLEQAG